MKRIWAALTRQRKFDRARVFNVLVRPTRNNRGVAILLALAFITIMMFIAVEISFDSQVEYHVATGEYDRLKAYYAAKAGAELSLFRIELFNQAMQAVGSKLGSNAKMLDLIWSFPFVWPPLTPPELDAASLDQIKTSTKESFMDAEFNTTIEPESGRIDVNDLASPSPALEKSTHAQVVKILQNKMENDQKFQRDNSSLVPEQLVNNIADYIDDDNVSRNGGNENALYPDYEKGMPPNRPMVSIQELHMVAGMTDQIYEVLATELTTYGLKGVNVNRAPNEILQSIDPQITKEIADGIIKWRDDAETSGHGQFADEGAFKTALTSLGVNVSKFNEGKVPLYYGAEHIFRVKSTGRFGNSSREIIAIVYDFDTVKQRLQSLMPTSSTTTTLNPQGQPPPVAPPSTTTTTLPGQSTNGQPKIVDWIEN
jgi:general secretion pathway protein K